MAQSTADSIICLVDGKFSEENENYVDDYSGVMWTIQTIAATPHFKRDPPTIGHVKRVLVIIICCIFSATSPCLLTDSLMMLRCD